MALAVGAVLIEGQTCGELTVNVPDPDLLSADKLAIGISTYDCKIISTSN
jgi:hypothetical protein